MKQWYGQVLMSYWQEIWVEAETEEKAKELMLNKFDIAQADPGEGEVWDIQEVKQGEPAC